MRMPNLSSNTSWEDPFGENKGIVYPFLGILMSTAISLNIVSCVIMTKNKDLRKHNQFLVYLTISLTETFIDILYIVLLFWREKNVYYFCAYVFLLYGIGRENIQVYLLYLCIERCFALTVSLNSVFRKMITVKGRILVFVFCTVLSTVIFAPVNLVYAVKDPLTCGPEHLFGNNGRFVLRYSRTVFSLQIASMLVIYLYIGKKIRTLTVPNVSNVHPSRLVKDVRVQPLDLPTTSNKNENTVSTENTNCCTTNSSDTASQITKVTAENSGDTNRPPNKERKDNASIGKWKPRTLKLLRSAILTTVIPSIPMVVLHTVDLFDPRFMTATLDVIISLCNVLHAIIFPLVFIVTVTQYNCCKKVHS